MKARIVEIIKPNGDVRYQIQQKHWLFRWMWVGVGCNSWDAYVQDTYTTLKDAKKQLCWYDGTKSKCTVICER
jgi:hypothetical protein